MDNCNDDKPPSNKTDLGFSTRIFSTVNSLARRLKELRELWTGDWYICPIRISLHSRCHSLLIYIQGER